MRVLRQNRAARLFFPSPLRLLGANSGSFLGFSLAHCQFDRDDVLREILNGTDDESNVVISS